MFFGCFFVKEIDEGIVLGYIVEIEVYMGVGDRVVYSFNNCWMKWIEIMFVEVGWVYIYVMYIYILLNVVVVEVGVL